MRDTRSWGKIGGKARDHRQVEKRDSCDKKPRSFRKAVEVTAVTKYHAGRDGEDDEIEPADEYNVERGDTINRPRGNNREAEEYYDEGRSQVICQKGSSTEWQACSQVKSKGNNSHPTAARWPIEEFDSERSDHQNTDERCEGRLTFPLWRKAARFRQSRVGKVE